MTEPRHRLELLESRIDILKEFINALLLKDRGVVLLWVDEYDELVKEAEAA